MKCLRPLVPFLVLLAFAAGCGRETATSPSDPSASLVATDGSTLDAAPSGSCQGPDSSYMATTSDFGASFDGYQIPTQRSLSITWGLAALDDAGTLVMQADDALWGSEDDGCSWTRLRIQHAIDLKTGRISSGPVQNAEGIFRVAAGPDGHAYAWQDNGGRVFRVQHLVGRGASWNVIEVGSPVSGLKGFAVDPRDPLHVRAAGDEGRIHESFDGGISWQPRGVAAMPGGYLGYVMAFDPGDFDHAVYGRVTDGGFVTFDGGVSWTRSTGLASVEKGSVNLFNAVISGADGNVVYAMALDLAENLGGHPSGGRHIYASTDGGLTFVPVLDHLSEGVFLSNGPVMLADPDDADRLIFLSSSKPAFGGTRFYDYDRASDVLTTVVNQSIPQIRVLALSRVAPGAMHAGFDWF